MRKLLLTALLWVLAPVLALAQAPGVNSPWNPVWSIPYPSIQRTYSQAMSNLVVSTSATTWLQICGSATTTVHVTRITIAGRATAAAAVDIQLIKTSTAATGGTVAAGQPFGGVAVTGNSYDSSDVAATALVTAWTANPTVGTPIVASAGWLWAGQAFFGNLTTGQPGIPTVINFGDHPGKAITLRGAAQCLAVSSAVGTAPGSGNLTDFSIEWTEE